MKQEIPRGTVHMGAHSGNTHKAIPTEMPDTRFELHQTSFSAPPPPPVDSPAHRRWILCRISQSTQGVAIRCPIPTPISTGPLVGYMPRRIKSLRPPPPHTHLWCAPLRRLCGGPRRSILCTPHSPDVAAAAGVTVMTGMPVGRSPGGRQGRACAGPGNAARG